MSYYLGIDAGGTKTTCVLADETTVLARTTGGSIKIMRVSEQEAETNLTLLLKELTSQSGVGMDSMACTCIGLAGITVARVEQWTRSALQKKLSGKILICGDEEIALDGAFSGEPGVLVMAGTGSNVIGRKMDGSVFHIGGWGPAVSDEGSGHWIGLQAVRAVLHAFDRGDGTLLQAAVLKQWQITTIPEMVAVANQVPGPDFSQLAPVVVECADKGDAVACAVLEDAGRDLGRFVTLALKKVQDSAATPEARVRLAFTGSVLEKIPQVRHALVATVQHSLRNIEVRSEPVDSAMGALWRARNSKELSLYAASSPHPSASLI